MQSWQENNQIAAFAASVLRSGSQGFERGSLERRIFGHGIQERGREKRGKLPGKEGNEEKVQSTFFLSL